MKQNNRAIDPQDEIVAGSGICFGVWYLVRMAPFKHVGILTWAIALTLIPFVSGCATPSKSEEANKLYHVGLVWLKEPGNMEHRQKIIEATHSFAREIPEVQFVSVGKPFPKASSFGDDSFDIGFVMRLEDRAAMERYAKHPVHQKAAKEVFFPLARKILFYDFTSE